MPSIAIQTVLTRKQIKAAAAKARREAEKKRRVEIAELAALAAERADEAIAPAVLRRPVIGPGGEVLRGAKVERSGVSFQRANVVRNLFKRSPDAIKEHHVHAAERLLRTYTAVAGGVGLGSSDYMSKSAGGGGFTGGVSEAKHRRLLEQCQARAELEGALTFMGGLIEVVSAVVFDCLDITTWSDARGINYRVGLGMLAAALDRLCEFYDPEFGRERVMRIRSVQVGVREAVI